MYAFCMQPPEAGDRTPRGRRSRGSRLSTYEDLGPVQKRPVKVREAPRRKRGLLVLSAVLVVCAAVASAVALFLHSNSDLSAGAPPTPAQYGVIFVVDGAAPETLRMARTPNIATLQANGVIYRNAWVGQLENDSLTANATIGTGLYPWDHGLVGPQWLDPKTRQIQRLTDPTQVRVGSLDQLMESRGIVSFSTLLKSRNPSTRILSVGGAGCGAAAAAGTWTADYVLCPARQGRTWISSSVAGHSLPNGLAAETPPPVPVATGPGLAPTVEGWRLGQEDDWVTRQTVLAMRSTHPRLIVVNFPEISSIARWAPAGRRDQVLQELVAGIDRDIGQILNEMRRERTFSRAVFAVTSDGAISPVSRRVDRSLIDEAILAAGGETVYFDADGSAMIGLRDPLQAEPVAQVIQGQPLPGVDGLYYKTQTGSSWSYAQQYRNPHLPAAASRSLAYLLWTMASATSPDVVAVYAPHTTTGDPRLGRFRRSGAGLGVEWDQQHIPLVISGHGVVQGSASRFPARLLDLAPTMETLMGLTPPGQGGIPLGDAMLLPPPTLRGRQRTTARWLDPLVRALQRRLQLSR